MRSHDPISLGRYEAPVLHIQLISGHGEGKASSATRPCGGGPSAPGREKSVY